MSHGTLHPIRWDEIPEEATSPFITRRVLHTPALTVIHLSFKSGAVVPLHNHVHEQVTTVLEGTIRFEAGGKSVVLQTGQSLHVPSDLPHSAEALEDSRSMEVFVPARTDWIK
jgi:quercetin dioxygenase-like cupin family protein